MKKVGLAIVALSVVAAAGTGSLYAYDASRSDLIAQGVTAAGVPLGGMTPREARAVLERRVVARFETPLKLRWRGATFVSPAELYEIVLDEDGDLHWLAPQRVSPRSAHHLSSAWLLRPRPPRKAPTGPRLNATPRQAGRSRAYEATSVIKFMLLVAYLDRLARERPITASDRGLLEPMIRLSDNKAATAIYARLGDAALGCDADHGHARDTVRGIAARAPG